MQNFSLGGSSAISLSPMRYIQSASSFKTVMRFYCKYLCDTLLEPNPQQTQACFAMLPPCPSSQVRKWGMGRGRRISRSTACVPLGCTAKGYEIVKHSLFLMLCANFQKAWGYKRAMPPHILGSSFLIPGKNLGPIGDALRRCLINNCINLLQPLRNCCRLQPPRGSPSPFEQTEKEVWTFRTFGEENFEEDRQKLLK